MQHTKVKTKGRVPGISVKQRRADAQQGFCKVANGSDKFQSEKPKLSKSIFGTSCNTNRFNPSRLNFDLKSGYDVLRVHGRDTDYPMIEKSKALSIYNCIKHVPGFRNKKFTKVNDAVSHVFKETYRLFGTDWQIIDANGNTVNDNEIEENYKTHRTPVYFLQIINETMETDNTRWQEIEPVLDIENKRIKRAIIMCLNIVVHEFGFEIKDSGSYSTMDVDEWVSMECEQLNDYLHSLYQEFEEAHGRPFGPDKALDDELPEGVAIIETMQDLNELDFFSDLFNTTAKPFFEKIGKMKPNVRYIKNVMRDLVATELYEWMNHILILKKQKFNISNYVIDSFRETEHNMYDESSISPLCGYGYVFAEQSVYTKAMEHDLNEMANNYCMKPFTFNTVVVPEKGIIYKTPDIPLGEWINRIFHFNFKDMAYES